MHPSDLSLSEYVDDSLGAEQRGIVADAVARWLVAQEPCTGLDRVACPAHRTALAEVSEKCEWFCG